MPTQGNLPVVAKFMCVRASHCGRSAPSGQHGTWCVQSSLNGFPSYSLLAQRCVPTRWLVGRREEEDLLSTFHNRRWLEARHSTYICGQPQARTRSLSSCLQNRLMMMYCGALFNGSFSTSLSSRTVLGLVQRLFAGESRCWWMHTRRRSCLARRRDFRYHEVQRIADTSNAHLSLGPVAVSLDLLALANDDQNGDQPLRSQCTSLTAIPISRFLSLWSRSGHLGFLHCPSGQPSWDFSCIPSELFRVTLQAARPSDQTLPCLIAPLHGNSCNPLLRAT